MLGGEIGDLKVPLKGDRVDMEHGYLDGFTINTNVRDMETADEPKAISHSGSDVSVYPPGNYYQEEPLILQKFDYRDRISAGSKDSACCFR